LNIGSKLPKTLTKNLKKFSHWVAIQIYQISLVLSFFCRKLHS